MEPKTLEECCHEMSATEIPNERFDPKTTDKLLAAKKPSPPVTFSDARCTECGENAFIGFSDWKNADGKQLVKKE
jgi:hypothetical protein